MGMDFIFYFNSVLLGVGLAMDAFSVSLANGLNDGRMKLRKMLLIAGVFAFFQAFMPMLGWLMVHTVLEYFTFFQQFIPWIALAILTIIGGKMIIEGLKQEDGVCEIKSLSVGTLIIQGIATSIDALSVGLTIGAQGVVPAIVSALIIALVTFVICLCGVKIGAKFGASCSNKATIAGGIILVLIGLEIFISGVFF
ncbi:MAG: manganese efflux pump [Clostridia bacterium]|nr:manganese efflux pump [Clostridia bacterium]